MYTDESLIAFCQRALQTPSFSGRERQMAELMKDKMLELGFDEAVFDRLGNVMRHYPRQKTRQNHFNGRAHRYGGCDRRGTVDARSVRRRDRPDGRIYGRGASDMKGSVTARWSSAAGRFAADRRSRAFAGDDLRAAARSTRSASRGSPPREVTRRVEAGLCHRRRGDVHQLSRSGSEGSAEVVVETEGVSGHSSNPDKGVNAVYGHDGR